MIGIIDYGRGNLFSLQRALQQLQLPARIITHARELSTCDAIILPGVGAFADAMAQLKKHSFIEPLTTHVQTGRRVLGICLGMQLLLSGSEEFGYCEGLGYIKGQVKPLPAYNPTDLTSTRIPNTGWRKLRLQHTEHRLATDIKQADLLYFVHSFAAQPEQSTSVLATIEVNGQAVPALIGQGNMLGVQGHPEKSGRAGLALLAALLQ